MQQSFTEMSRLPFPTLQLTSSVISKGGLQLMPRKLRTY